MVKTMQGDTHARVRRGLVVAPDTFNSVNRDYLVGD
jgi:hypothetical protein